MRGWWLTAGSVAVAVFSVSCNARKPDPDMDALNRNLAELRGLGHAVRAAVDGQVVSPEQEAEQRAQRAGRTLQPGEAIWLQSGKSRMLHLSQPVRRVSVAEPDLVSVLVFGPTTIMLNAKPLPERSVAQPAQAFGFAGIRSNQQGTLLGRTLTPQPRIAETSLVIWDDRGEDVHSVTVANFIEAQVMLEVTVAELDRNALEQHGLDVRAVQNDFIAAMFMGGGGGASAAGGQINQIPPLSGRLLPLTLTESAPNYAFIFPNEDVTVLLQLLEQEGLARVLAQPKLTALSGQNAVFQVGGEIPIRIATGFAANVEFKPFGTVVNFVPRVSEDGDILLTVNPEVSQPDYANRVEGIPTFRTRRASTSTKLRNGETLVIGGLLQNLVEERESGVPYLKDIPFLGYVFKYTSYQQVLTELVVVVTPRLIRPRAPGQEVPLPTDHGPLRSDEVRTQPDPAEVTRPRVPLLP